MKKIIPTLSLLLLTCAHNTECMLSRSLNKLGRIKHALARVARSASTRRTFHSTQRRNDWHLFRIVKQQESMLIERLGKYNRTLDSGFNFTIPIFESARTVCWNGVSGNRIDLRELVYSLPTQSVITKDNVAMKIDGLVYYEITDVYQSVYQIQDLPLAIEKLSQTTLRNIIGSMHLDETLTSRDAINKQLCDALGDKGTKDWGIRIRRVELQEINPPHDINIAMEKQMKAERYAREIKIIADGEKQAAILRAEGEQRSAILCAEGEKTSRILRAEGEAIERTKKAEAEQQAISMIAEGKAQERLKTAQAEQQAIEMVQQALPEQNSAHYMIAMQYLATLPKVTEGKGKIVVPVEMNAISGLFGSINTLLKNGADLTQK